MTDGKDKRERQTGTPARNPGKHAREDRLKLALRENLKRRKSQARGRNDGALPASHDEEAATTSGEQKNDLAG
jgi:hypothetical protein